MRSGVEEQRASKLTWRKPQMGSKWSLGSRGPGVGAAVQGAGRGTKVRRE